jgi:hypothetical protein
MSGSRINNVTKISSLALHLTNIHLLLLPVLKDEVWLKRLTKEDYWGLAPLFYGHVEPYGTSNSIWPDGSL